MLHETVSRYMSTRVCFQWSRSCSRLSYLKTPVSMETSAKSLRGWLMLINYMICIDMWYKDIWSMMICKRDLTSFQRWPVQRLKISHIDANLQWFLGRGLDCACSEPRTCAHLCSIMSLMCCVHSNWSWCYSCVCVLCLCVCVCCVCVCVVCVCYIQLPLRIWSCIVQE